MKLQTSRRAAFLLCLVWITGISDTGLLIAQEAPAADNEEMQVVADQYEYSPETGWAVGKGSVQVEYAGLVLTADSVRLNSETKDIEAKGNVVLKSAEFNWSGPAVAGNFGTRDFSFGVCRMQGGGWFGSGENGHLHADGKMTMDASSLTSCELAHPHYRIQAKRAVHFPDGKFRAYHTVFRLGDTPVFYWPIMFGDTNGISAGNLEIKPGYSGDWGAFLLLARTWELGRNGDTKLILDLRSKRGIALGNQTRWQTERSKTETFIYGMSDSDTPTTMGDYNRRFAAEKERYRAKAYHQFDFNDKLVLRVNLDKLSDIDMLEDWFEKEYDRNPQPQTYADLALGLDRVHVSLLARPRVNDFHSVVEALPELRLTQPRQPFLGGSGIYYQGATTAGSYEMKWRDFDITRPTTGVGATLADPESYESCRFDSTHFIYRPFHVREVFQVIPRAGFSLTHYTDSSAGNISGLQLIDMFEADDPNNPDSVTNVVNYDDNGGGLTRLAGEIGLEITTKLYRVWPNYRNGSMKIDGLRHLLEPYLNYTLIADPSEDRENIYFFDSTDRLLEQNFVRFGLNQRVQTRRKAKIYTLARMQTYADFNFTTAGAGDRNGSGNLANRIEFQPKQNMTFWNKVVADMDDSEVTRAEIGLTMGRPEHIQFEFSYLMRSDHFSKPAFSMGSSLLDFAGDQGLIDQYYAKTHAIAGQLRLAITEKMLGSIRLEYDLDEQQLTRQTLLVERDLHCWIGSLQLDSDNGDLEVRPSIVPCPVMAMFLAR